GKKPNPTGTIRSVRRSKKTITRPWKGKSWLPSGASTVLLRSSTRPGTNAAIGILTMSEPQLIQRERTNLHELVTLAAARAGAEQEIVSRFRTQQAESESRLQEALQQIAARFQAEKAATENEFAILQQSIAASYEAETQAAKVELAESRHRLA